jgi:hypothetical protein
MNYEKMWKSAAATLAFATLAFAGASPARAGMIVGDTANSEHSLGDFSGSLTYTFTDSTNASLVVSLTNTSSAANGGYLTAFVLNNPDDLITGIGLTSTSASFDTLLFDDDGVNGTPFGHFDFGATTEASGPPRHGIAVGDTVVFTFTLTGTMLDTLSMGQFDDALSVAPGIGQGTQSFVARFRGFRDDGSDKVPGTVVLTAVPEPGTFTLALSGFCLLGLSMSRRLKRRSGTEGAI